MTKSCRKSQELYKEAPWIYKWNKQDHRLQDEYKKSIRYLYANNENVETKIKNTVSFTVASKNEILRYTLIKHAQDLFSENDEMVIK